MKLLLTALLSSLLTAAAFLQAYGPPKLENAKVAVTELVYEPGVARARHVRARDQVIVFLDDCRYERTDPETGEKTIRQRRAGDVIWHDKGEVAPVLVNRGEKAYRTLVIELK